MVLLAAALLTVVVTKSATQEVPGIAYMEILKTAPRGEGEKIPSVTSDPKEVNTPFDVMLNYDFYPFDEESSEDEVDFRDAEDEDKTQVLSVIERPPSTDNTPVVSSEKREDKDPAAVSKQQPMAEEDLSSGSALGEPEEQYTDALPIATSRSSEGELPKHPATEESVVQSAEESVRRVKAVRAKYSSGEKQTSEETSALNRQLSARYISSEDYYSAKYPSYGYSPTDGKYPKEQYPPQDYPSRYYPLSPYYPSYGYGVPLYAATGYQDPYYPTGSYSPYSIPRAGYIDSYGATGYPPNLGSGYYYPRQENPLGKDSPRTSEEGVLPETQSNVGTSSEYQPDDSVAPTFPRESQDTRGVEVSDEDPEEIFAPTASRRQSAYVPNRYVSRAKKPLRSETRSPVYRPRAKEEPRRPSHNKNREEAPPRNEPILPAGVDKKDRDAVRYYTGLQREIEKSELLSDAVRDVRSREGKSVKELRRSSSLSTTTTTAVPVPDIDKVKRSFGTHPLYRNLPHSSSSLVKAGALVHKEEYEDEDDEYDNLYLPVRAKSLELEEIREVKEHFNILVPKVAYKASSFPKSAGYPGQGLYIPAITTFRPYEIPKYNKHLKPPASAAHGYDSRSPYYRTARPSSHESRRQKPLYHEFEKHRPSSYDSGNISPSSYDSGKTRPSSYESLKTRPSSYDSGKTRPSSYVSLKTRPSSYDSEKHYRPHGFSDSKGVAPKAYYSPTSKPYALTTARPYYPRPLTTSRLYYPLTSRPKTPLNPTVASHPRPHSPPASKKVTPRPREVAIYRPKSTPKATSKPRPTVANAPYLRLTATPRTRQNPLPEKPKRPSSSFPSSFKEEPTRQGRGLARVPSSIQRDQGPPPALKDQVREKRRHDLETQIDSSIGFPRFGYNIDRYFKDFPAFGYFDFDHR